MAGNLARDEAGNIWEIDAQGNPLRLHQQAGVQIKPADPEMPYKAPIAAGHAAAAAYEAPKAVADIGATQAQAGKSTVDAATARATLPYAAPKAAAETRSAVANAAITENKLREEQVAAAKSEMEKFGGEEQVDQLIRSVERAKKLVGMSTAGFAGSALSGVHGTDAFDLRKVIEQDVRGNVFLQRLQAMKEENPSANGGTGIGRIMQAEIPMITGSSGALDVGMKPSALLESLNNIEHGALRMKAKVNGQNPDDPHVLAAFATHIGSAPPPSEGGNQTPGGPHGPDYSPMVGGPGAALAQTDPNSPLGVFKTTYRQQPDPAATQALASFVRHGVPFDTVKAYAQAHGFVPPSESDYAKGVAFAQAHGASAVNVEANRSVPTTVAQRLASSPAASFVTGAATGATAGLSDVAGRNFVPGWDVNRQALAGTHGTADLLGNVAGGAAGMFGASTAADALGVAARARLALGAAKAAKLGQFAPLAQDIGYGATYGASENPNNPLGGAALGALTGGAGGIGARAVTRGIGNSIAPTGGNLAPIFNANPDFRPTIGQRLSASDSRFVRALGMGEQAAESIPFTGGIQTAARTAAGDEMQRGAFNQALGEIGHRLPDGVSKGPQAHAYMQNAFDGAYDNARAGMQFVPDPQFAHDLGNWQRSTDGLALTKDQTAHVQNVIGSAMNGRVGPGGTMDGANYVQAASDLGKVARAWSANPATAGQASYLRNYISIMDDAAKRASPPEAGAALDAANRGYAKAVIVENAGKSAGGDPAEFSGKQLLRAVQNSDPSVRDRAFLRGQGLMQDYAMAAAKLSPSLPDSGTGQRLAWMKAAGTGEAAGLGTAAALGHPMALAPWALDTFANLPGVRNAVGAAMAPRSAVLPPALADATNLVGQGLYKRSNALGMFGAPAALDYYLGQ